MNLWKGITTTLTKSITTIHQIHTSPFLANPVYSTLEKLHFQNMKNLEKPFVIKKKRPLDGKPYAKGIVIKTLIKHPRKPNSANRKCVLLKLPNGREMVAHIPGEGHNLQEHQVVLCKVKRLRDTPGVWLKCIRGKFDLPHVKKSSS